MGKIRVKNWSSFQHYKERRPPWIKLHRELLDNYEFHCLPVASKALAPCLWLLASESEDGSISYDMEMLSFRLRMTQNELTQALKPLTDKGFVFVEEGDSASLAECLRDADSETEERRVETDASAVGEVIPDWVPREQWNGFLQMRKKVWKRPVTGRALTLAISKLEKLRSDGHDPAAVLDQSTLNGWKGLFPITTSQAESFGKPVQPINGGYRPPKATSLAEAKL